MAIVNENYIDTADIEFCWEIELGNGIIGRNILIDGNRVNYIITKDAKVYNIKTEKELHQHVGKKCPYKVVNIQLGKRGKYKTVLIHRLLGLAYIPNPDNKPVINHKDGNKMNLELSNLEWSTYSENAQHAIDTGLRGPIYRNSQDSNLTTHTLSEVLEVCDLLEKGYSPKYIAMVYDKFTYDFVHHIYKRDTWKEITYGRDFSRVKKFSRYFTPEEVSKMEELFIEGNTVKQVIDIMNWDYTERLRGRVRQIKKRVCKELS